jgi:hypothetical protein
MDKVLLAPRKDPVRGVELFNINLLRDLAELGYNITLPLHESWIIYLNNKKNTDIKQFKIVIL